MSPDATMTYEQAVIAREILGGLPKYANEVWDGCRIDLLIIGAVLMDIGESGEIPGKDDVERFWQAIHDLMLIYKDMKRTAALNAGGGLRK